MCFRTERSTDQVIKPVNLEALSKWVHAVPEDVKRDVTVLAPMLEKMGYDPYAYPPNYGDPDAFVQENTAHIKNNEDYWRKKGQEVLYAQNAGKAAAAAGGGGGGGGNGGAARNAPAADNNKKAQTIYKEVDGNKGDNAAGQQDNPAVNNGGSS